MELIGGNNQHKYTHEWGVGAVFRMLYKWKCPLVDSNNANDPSRSEMIVCIYKNIVIQSFLKSFKYFVYDLYIVPER